MCPIKQRLQSESVIGAGLNQLKDEGWDGLAPNKVAKRLGYNF